MQVEVEIRVIYGDTDAMGVVYYSNYLKWFEIGRTEWLRRIGVSYREIEEMGIYAPASKVFCHYLKPARYDDLILIRTTLGYCKKASIKFDYGIHLKGSEETLARGYSIHAFVDREGRITRTPAALVQKLKASQQG